MIDTKRRRSFRSLILRKRTLGAVLAVVLLAIVVPSAANAHGATIDVSRNGSVYYVTGSNFPHRGTAVVWAKLAGQAEQRNVRLKNGAFRLTYVRPAGSDQSAVAKAWASNTFAKTSKRVVRDRSRNTSAEQTTTTTAPVETTAAPTTTTTAVTNGTAGLVAGQGSTPSTAAPTTTTAAPVASAASASNGAPDGYSLVFSDDFNGTTVDENKWGLYEGAGNENVGTRSRNAVSVGDGALRITGSDWQGGGLGTAHSQTYGYYEIRSRLVNAKGYNTATLLWPTSERWPVDGEIDISEMYNGDTSQSGGFVHWGANNSQIYNIQKGDFSQWHTFGVDWQPGHITYYLDGKQIWHITQSAAIPHNPHFLALQLDVARESYKQPGATFYVDYVKVYKKG